MRCYYDHDKLSTTNNKPAFDNNYYTGDGNTNKPKLRRITHTSDGEKIEKGKKYVFRLYQVDTPSNPIGSSPSSTPGTTPGITPGSTSPRTTSSPRSSFSASYATRRS